MAKKIDKQEMLKLKERLDKNQENQIRYQSKIKTKSEVQAKN